MTFRFPLPQGFAGAAVRVCCGGSLLLGSEQGPPADFGLDGRAADTFVGRRVSGWARMGWRPDRPLDLCIEDENGHRRVIKTGKLPKPGLRWPFTLDLRELGIDGNRLRISARTPDGRWQPLPDSPLLLTPAIRSPSRKPKALGRWRVTSTGSSSGPTPQRAPSVDIIIPVYRGRQDTLRCIDSACSTAPQATVIVVDDATDDPVLAAALDEMEAAGRITLLRNVENLGFVASVNRALAHNPDRDAVLLNSDALVFGDWLERLQAAAYRTPRVGTVTPFSNSGTIAGYPRHGEQVLSVDEAAALHELAAASHAQLSREIPVGVGFCLYVRRDCLREVGGFDADAFGKGYGEESDFCMRARQHGWSHQLAADVFVYHGGGRSFGNRRAALLDRSHRLMNLRHPGYDRYIADFIAKDPLFTLRRALDVHRLAAIDGAFVLVVTLALTGGVQRFVAERCREIRVRGLVPLILRPLGGDGRCELWTDALDVSNVRYDIPSELPLLDALLRRLPIQYVEIQHFLHLDPRVIDAVRGLGLPYDVFVHDYAWICPRITLIDGSGSYCGEPAVSVCNTCVRRNGSQLGGKAMSVDALRQRSATWLSGARRVFAPSTDTASRLQKYFPLAIEVRPHAKPAASAKPHPRSSRVVRVAVIGAIGEHKGYRVLLNCARDAVRRNLPLEFVVIGYTCADRPLHETGKVFVTGKYSEGEAGHLLRREQPDIAFLPSVWPETWCYAFDEAVAVGLPVVAFELGAIAERMREMAAGAILQLGEKPRRINDRLLEVAAQARMPPGIDGTARGISPGTSEAKIMNNTADVRNNLQSDAFTASVQVLPLPPGMYLFSVKAAAASKESEGQLRLPAMHVGLGPGVRSDQVEFLSGPSTDGAWLFAHEDMLITKVGAAGAALVLTSVRARGGEVLSVKVERLDGRSELETAVAEVARTPAAKAKNGSTSVAPGGVLPLRIGAHIRARGDMSFAGVPWAGRVAPGLWIESFSVKPLEGFEAQDVEYKGLTGSGFETPWMSDDKMCGTKGMSVPLVGFAVRLKPSSKAAQYDCEYSGYFKSGATVGPLRNGAPCRS
ncbi:MAG TPA: glycosyltransferase, partial [Steroidobacteraceae bacterium]|nr:glycosyltransferase [Steroidobacteraceae bacterium]